MTNQASAVRPRFLQPLLSIRRASGLVLTGQPEVNFPIADKPRRKLSAANHSFLSTLAYYGQTFSHS